MSQEIVDLKEVLERVQNDKELLLELLDIFIEDYPLKIEAIRQGIQEKNFEKLRDASHSMKGASGNIAAKRINTLFVQIEQLVKMNSTDGIEDLLKSLEQAFSDFKDYTEKLKQDFKK